VARYYFDLWDEAGVSVDDEGMELVSLQRVQEEAARSLANMARDAASKIDGVAECAMAVEVRDDRGPLLRLTFTYEGNRRQWQ
jgi:hypothetical protein